MMRFIRPAVSDWRTLARELAVTFVGVLLALAASAWWGERQDRSRERAYMAQLTSDVDRALAPSKLPASVAAESSAALATVHLIRAFRAPKPPPADSIAQWLFAAESFDSYVPPLGTARALLSTGDINLIRSDIVRAIVVAMVSGAEDMVSRTHDYRLKWQAQAEDLERYTDFIALSARTRGSVSTDSAA